MRCKKCEYRLWNLRSRSCPECGLPFRPSEYEFAPNSVQFQCPHCAQSYYGTALNGHLIPPAFTCVRCQQPVTMDEMVLLPTEGVAEEQTGNEIMPWLARRQIGFFKGWFRTVGMALGRPGRMLELTPVESPLGSALWFALLAMLVVTLFGCSPWVALIFGFGAGSPQDVLQIAMAVGIFAASLVAIFFLWGAIAHGMLKITGGSAHGISRTYQALGYSSGAFVLQGIPCLGFYLEIGLVWWIVAAILAVRVAQKVHGGRATLAIMIPPGLIIGGLITTWIIMVTTALGTIGGSFNQPMPITSPGSGAQHAATTLLNWAADEDDGAGPDHALRLVMDQIAGGDTTLANLTPYSYPATTRLGNITLGEFIVLTPERQEVEIANLTSRMPSDVVAHRLGDYVYTYHGMDLNSVDAGLWVVIVHPPSLGAPLAVGLTDGSVKNLSPATFDTDLEAQNDLRDRYNLPPLPHPKDVPVEGSGPAQEED